MSNLHGCNIFMMLDHIRAYYSIPVATEDIPKAASLKPCSLFEFKGMTFGLKNVALMIQRYTNTTLRGLQCDFSYSDDVLVTSEIQDEIEQHFRAVFKLL